MKYGSNAQKQQWLLPLLQGKIRHEDDYEHLIIDDNDGLNDRSAFAMTEPSVASSDASIVHHHQNSA